MLIRGSADTLEIAIRDESAAERFGVEAGERVTVRPAS
jgi:S-adenosylmethionine hydrolase